ncbi:hypothetical protein LINPERHAP1_LOCUS34790 [Linum perenne]
MLATGSSKSKLTRQPRLQFCLVKSWFLLTNLLWKFWSSEIGFIGTGWLG